MTTNVNQKPHMQIMQVLKETPPSQIAELEFVKNKFIDNYNFCHKDKVGELMYHRQVVHFKQLIQASDKLRTADPFSLYACFVTAAVNGYSLDPADNEVYLIPLDGKAYLWRQAGAHVRRLMSSGQIVSADQAKLVYEDDDFEVVNGRVVKHVEKFKSEKIIAGYVRFVIDRKGNDKYFIYRRSDWEAWRKKSKQAGGENWNSNGQPVAAFLRTKIVKHAALDKSWAAGSNSVAAERFDVEIEETEDVQHEEIKKQQPALSVNGQGAMEAPSSSATDDDSFTNSNEQNTGSPVTMTDDDF
jgi:recombinational DNA repair protein RecT